jgi:hypothetical protein
MGIQDYTNLIQAGSAVAIVVFSVLSYKTAMRALEESKRQADAATAALAEASKQAELSQAAVDAANASVVESRRQTQLSRIPFIRLARPMLAISTEGQPCFEISAANLGPGPALELRLSVDRQDHPTSDWFRDFEGTPMLPLLEAETLMSLSYSAAALWNTDANWEEGISSVGTGLAPTHQPIVSVRLRLTLTYLSLLGGRATQVHIWETDRIHLPPDPWTWRLETLTLDPGPDNGASVTVHRPD